MRRFVACCSAFLLALAVLGACGGDSAKTTSETNASDTTSPDDGSGNDFAQLYADAAKARFKITFDSPNDDSTVYAQDGNGKSVYGAGDSQTFISPSGTVTCSTVSGTSTCTQVPVGATVNPFLGIFNAGQTYIQALGNFADKESKTIAGRDAECVTFSKETVKDAGPAGRAIASAIKGSLTYCVDKDTGVLLESSTTDEGGTTTNSFKVTKFEEPSDSDFTPPATAQTSPSYTIPGQ